MEYVLKVKNEDKIISKVLNDCPFLNKDYAEKIVHTVIENVDFSFEHKVECEDVEMNEVKLQTQQQVDNTFDILQYVTEDNLKAFSKIMQDTLFDRINRNIGIDNIDYEDLLTTYRYRSSYIEYGGAKYKDIAYDPKYETRDYILLSKFFIGGIYSNEAWHRNRDNTRIHILGTQNANIPALLDKDLYTKDILMPHVYDTLLRGMPKYYTVTQQDMEKINRYLYFSMHPMINGG